VSKGKHSRGVITTPPERPGAGGHLVPALHPPALGWHGRHGPAVPRSWLVSSPQSCAEEGAADDVVLIIKTLAPVGFFFLLGLALI